MTDSEQLAHEYFNQLQEANATIFQLRTQLSTQLQPNAVSNRKMTLIARSGESAMS